MRAHKPACLRRCGRPRRTADPGPKGTHSEVGCRTVWAGPQADQVTRRRRASASAARHQRQADDRFAHEPATWRLRSWSGFFIACVAAFAVCRWRDAGRYGPLATRWEQLANLRAAPMGLSLLGHPRHCGPWCCTDRGSDRPLAAHVDSPCYDVCATRASAPHAADEDVLCGNDREWAPDHSAVGAPADGNRWRPVGSIWNAFTAQ